MSNRALLAAISGCLRRAVQPFTLSGTLTATATVGEAYSSTLTLGGDYVAPVTMGLDAGSLPSWMSVSVSGATVTYSGTPTAAASAVTFTPKATDSNSLVAVGSSQSVTASAGSSMTLVSTTYVRDTTTSSAGVTVTVPSVQTGDKIVVLFAGLLASGWSHVCSDNDSNSYTTGTSQFSGSGVRSIAGFVATAAHDVTNLAVKVKEAGSHYIDGLMTVYVLRGAGTVTWANGGYLSNPPNSASKLPEVSSAYDVQNGSAVLLLATAYVSGGTLDTTASAPETLTHDTDTAASSVPANMWHYLASAAATGQTVDFSISPTSSYRLLWITCVVDPA